MSRHCNQTLAKSRIKLGDKKIEIINDDIYYSKDITCGFDMKALAGKLVQEHYKDKVRTPFILNIDLDMYLINPLPMSVFLYLPTTRTFNGSTVVGQYSSTEKINSGIIYRGNKPFDTGFILTDVESKFFTIWANDIKKYRDIVNNPNALNTDLTDGQLEYLTTKSNLPKDLQIDSIEEWLISYYHYNAEKYQYDIDIIPLSDYQYGEFYPKELLPAGTEPLFYHYHLYDGLRSAESGTFKTIKDIILNATLKRIHNANNAQIT